MTSCACGSGGFGVGDGIGVGPAEGANSGAVDLEVGLGDGMATVLPPWTRPREIFCQATITAPCGRGAALHPDRCFGRLERRAGGAGGR